MLKSFDIYSQNNVLKIIVALNLLLVGTGSLLYTSRVITKLEAREVQYVQLYAKALTNVVNSTDLNEDVNFVVAEILSINQNSTIPVVYVNEHNEPSQKWNVDIPEGLTPAEERQFLRETIAEMREEMQAEGRGAIRVDLRNGDFGLIYYGHSLLLRQLKYFPYALIVIILALAVLAYISFSSSRRAEQNRVWVGLAKETAHQLGTPLSSLMAWVEYMRSDPEHYEESVTDEIEKDVQRLETITARFSSIGSIPTLKDERINDVVRQFVDYLSKRISTKVKMSLETKLSDEQTVMVNRLLFEWVIENVCKNAVDAMGGIGSLHIRLLPLSNDQIAIDITDTGKGISKANLQKVFTPGYSTKKRGWGLGLTLAKRIVEEYHNGRLFVKSSEVGKGTTFRMMLNAEVIKTPAPTSTARSTVR